MSDEHWSVLEARLEKEVELSEWVKIPGKEQGMKIEIVERDTHKGYKVERPAQARTEEARYYAMMVVKFGKRVIGPTVIAQPWKEKVA